MGDPPSRDERARGCLLGGAAGDALGAPVEFLSREEILHRFGSQGIRDFAPAYGGMGRITDDTQMSLFTAEGLLLAMRGGGTGRSQCVRSVHRAYLRWLRTQGVSSRHPSFERASEGWLLGIPALHVRRTPGNTCVEGLRSERMGRIELPLNASKGCGGVMRVAPVGLCPGVDDAFRAGCEIAALTHGHPSGYLAGGFLALAVRELVAGATLEGACQESLEELKRWPGHEECTRAVESALARARSDEPSAAAVEALGRGWVAEEALAIAVYCACAARDLERGVCLAVNHDGDSDSTGAITGNLLGAALGVKAIPRRWLDLLELRAEIENVARELRAASAGRAHATPCADPQ